MLWKYFHIERICLRDLLAALQIEHDGRERDGSSSASFLASKGWAVQRDIGPQPKAAKETPEASDVATMAAAHLLNAEFTTI